MSIAIKIANINEFKNFMQKKQEETKKILAESVKEATLLVHNQVKESIARGTNAPVTVDTGRFLNSIDFEATGENEARVYTDLEYAPFLEYGTSKMAARPHFQNTAFVIAPGVKEIFSNNVQKI
jgi:HK97 gp10 family phage protein